MLTAAVCGVYLPTSQNNAAFAVARDKGGTRVYYFYHLKHNTGSHPSPDALVFLTSQFNHSNPIHLVIYNHGLRNNVLQTAQIWQISEQFKKARANTVLILPEWAVNPQKPSLESGSFYKPGFFRKMLKEIFDRTAELHGLSENNIATISIASYSGGYRAAAAEIYENDLQDQITSLTLFDSLYKTDIFDRWILDNVVALANGTKHYRNFFSDTSLQSIAQLQRVESMLCNIKESSPRLVADLDHPQSKLSCNQIFSAGIIFKFTQLGSRGQLPHMNVPSLYMPILFRHPR